MLVHAHLHAANQESEQARGSLAKTATLWGRLPLSAFSRSTTFPLLNLWRDSPKRAAGNTKDSSAMCKSFLLSLLKNAGPDESADREGGFAKSCRLICLGILHKST